MPSSCAGSTAAMTARPVSRAHPSETGDVASSAPQPSAEQGIVADLRTALQTSRSIGIALGILVERHKITPDEAFARLSHASQVTNRKLRDIAADLVDTGVEPRQARSDGAQRPVRKRAPGAPGPRPLAVDPPG